MGPNIFYGYILLWIKLNDALRVCWWLKVWELNVLPWQDGWAHTKNSQSLNFCPNLMRLCKNYDKGSVEWVLKLQPHRTNFSHRKPNPGCHFIMARGPIGKLAISKTPVKPNDFELATSRNIKLIWNFAHLFISYVGWLEQSLMLIAHEIRPGDLKVGPYNLLFPSCSLRNLKLRNWCLAAF